MKRLLAFPLFVGLVWLLSLGATAPEITTTDSTTSTITISLDSTGMSTQDSLILILGTTPDDSSDGSGTETSTTVDTTGHVFSSLVPGTLYYIMARVDSGGNKAYTTLNTSSGGGGDTVRVEFPQELSVRSDFVQLYDAISWNGLTGTTTAPTYTTILTMDSTAATVQNGSSDSTMWFQSAPYIGVHYEFSSGDSVATTLYAMGGRIPGGELAPQVAVLDSEQVTSMIGDVSFEIPIGTGQVYIRATAYIAHERDSDLSLWLRSHWFEPR